MKDIPSKFKAKHYEPGRNAPCVCGSGIKFKKCCQGVYSSNAANLFSTAYNQGNFEQALIEGRRHFTWYILCHKAHTASRLPSNLDGINKLLKIDIEALSHLLENIRRCYYHLGRSADFPNVINSVKDLIDDNRWNGKIAYAEGLWNLIDQEDRNSAYESIASIDIESSNDPDVLSLYLDVGPRELPLPQKLDIADRIITNTRRESVKLQYRAFQAMEYYKVCQHKEGDKIFEDAFFEFRTLPEEKQSAYGRTHYAFALEIYGKSGTKIMAIEEAIETTSALIKEAIENQYAKKHIGDLYRLLGVCEEAIGNHNKAIEAYTGSLDVYSNDLTKLFLARSLCNSDKIELARQQLNETEVSNLDIHGRFDLAISWALLAAKSVQVNDIKIAKSKLEEAKNKDPLFIQLRDSWMIDLLKMNPKAESGTFKTLIGKLNNWVTLKPNFFGIGVDINKIIEDVINEEPTASQKEN